MFKTRLISGIALVVIQLIVLIVRGPLLLGVTGIIAMIGLFEYYRALGLHKEPAAWCGYIFSAFLYVYVYLGEYGNVAMNAMGGIVKYGSAMLIVLMCFYVFSYPKYDIRQIAEIAFGPVYIPFMLLYVNEMSFEWGNILVWTIFLTAWGCDTCAYCAGKLFGKHKMTPVLSPKKTVEGAIGGIAGAFLINLIFLMIFRTKSNLDISTTQVVIISILAGAGAFVSMVGDLCASAIKRNVGIKDYGKIIPGHGGVMDRFDSIIITAPFMFWMVTTVMQGKFLI